MERNLGDIKSAAFLGIGPLIDSNSITTLVKETTASDTCNSLPRFLPTTPS